MAQSAGLNSLENIILYCESFESAKADRDRLQEEPSSVGSIDVNGLSKEESAIAAAAVTSYRKSKSLKNGNCTYCRLKHGKSCPAYEKKCTECGHMNHAAEVCRKKKKKDNSKITSYRY